MSEEIKYEEFFDEIEKFKEKQNKQKQRGLNNYNILTSVLQPHDEVRLHSRMIHSFLNPHGEHFQDTLFLEKFLEVLQISDFLDLSNCSVYKEYENIDLYITDGNKHIIIENKVYAGDQSKQIKRYIEIIQKENNDLQADDILVVYLSLDREVPSKDSLDNLVIDDNYLKKGDENVARYKSIFYKNEILKWLEKCQYEVQNITNLNEVFRQYIDIVKMITEQYKEKIMSVENHLAKDEKTYKIAMEVYTSLPEKRKSIVEDFIKIELVEHLKDKLDDTWTIEMQDKSNLSKRFNSPLILYKEDWLNDKKSNLILGFEFDKENYYDGAFGIVKWAKNVDIKKDVVEAFQQEINLLEIECKTSAWWLHWEYLPNIEGKDDFAEYLLFDKDAKEDIKNRILEIIDIFERNSGLLTKINNSLNKKINKT